MTPPSIRSWLVCAHVNPPTHYVLYLHVSPFAHVLLVYQSYRLGLLRAASTLKLV